MQAEQALVQDRQWAAPLLWRGELCNVLALYIRKQILSLAEAQQVMGEAIRLYRWKLSSALKVGDGG